MWSFSQFLFLFIISQLDEPVFGSTHALVGNYSELNPKDCGITRLTNGFNDKCFKWHKNPINTLTAGRDAAINEVPWIAHIIINGPNVSGECSGSVIANQWILTAAHCLISEEPTLYTIVLGYDSIKSKKFFKFKAIEVRKHSEYNFPNQISNETLVLTSNDIGLIKLEHSIHSSQAIVGLVVSTQLKSICLPEKDIFNTEDEYVMNAGWGSVERYDQPLQMGYKRIHVKLYPDWVLALNRSVQFTGHNLILATVVDNQTMNCGGDSGGPLWQYHMGRAVIIGVYSFGSHDDTDCETSERSAQWFTRVSNYINWIENVTQSH